MPSHRQPRADHGPASPEGSREDTLPGSLVGLEARITATELRSTRFLTAISVLSTLVLAFLLALAFQLLQHVLGAKMDTAWICREGEADNCGDGMICIRGICQPERAPPTSCQVGDRCSSDCTPDAKLRCDNATGHYAPAAPPDLCKDRAMLAFLGDLYKKCKKPKDCTAKEVEAFALARQDFMDMTVRFPGTLALHFPTGQPKSLTSWPTKDIETHYVEGIRPLLPYFRDAKLIFVVAMASKGKSAKVMSVKRGQAADQLLTRALANELGPEAIPQLEKKFRLVHFGDQRPVDTDFFAKKVVQRFVGPDERTENQIRSMLEDPELPEADRIELGNLINQTAFLVPVHCDVEVP